MAGEMSALTSMDAQTAQTAQSNADAVRLKRQVDTLRERLSAGQSSEAELRKTCQDFEAIFMGKIWQSMRDTLPKDGYLHSPYEDQYMSMFDQELSRKMADSGGIGLGDMLFDQLKDKLKKASTEQAAGTQPIKPLHPEPVPLNPLRAEPRPLPPLAGMTPLASQDDAPGPLPPIRPVEPEHPTAADHTIRVDHRPAVAQLGQTRDLASLSGAELRLQVNALATRILSGEGQSAEAAMTPVAQGMPLTRVMEAGDPEMVLPEPQPAAGPLPEIVWPVDGQLTSDVPETLIGDEQGVQIALQGADAAPVRACWPGTVTFAGPDPESPDGSGNLVVVEHANGWRSYYRGVDELSVQPGQRLEAGSELATLAAGNRSTRQDLHFALSQGEVAHNPVRISNRMHAGLAIGQA